MKPLVGLFLFVGITSVSAQNGRFQQAVDYKMDVKMDVKNNQYTGIQTLKYTNNSSDTLTRVFYHLYYNAFQPGSMMDVRSRTIADPDARVKDRISKLKPEEIGYLHAKSLKMNARYQGPQQRLLSAGSKWIRQTHHGAEAGPAQEPLHTWPHAQPQPAAHAQIHCRPPAAPRLAAAGFAAGAVDAQLPGCAV